MLSFSIFFLNRKGCLTLQKLKWFIVTLPKFCVNVGIPSLPSFRPCAVPLFPHTHYYQECDFVPSGIYFITARRKQSSLGSLYGYEKRAPCLQGREKEYNKCYSGIERQQKECWKAGWESRLYLYHQYMAFIVIQ